MKEISIEHSEEYSPEKLPYYMESHTVAHAGNLCAPHIQNYIEIVYCYQGEMQFCCNDTPITLYPGDMITIFPNVIHFSGATACPCCFDLLKFDLEYIHYLPRTQNDISHIFPYINPKQLYFSKSVLESSPVPQVLSALHKEQREKLVEHRFAEKICHEVLYLWILRELNRRCPEAFLKRNTLGCRQEVYNILQYIWEHFELPLSAAETAERFHLSYSYFAAIVKQNTGMSFVQYRNYVRIYHAKKMLVESNRLIADIAAQLGFSNSSYFIEQFIHFEGVSPQKYRSICRQK